MQVQPRVVASEVVFERSCWELSAAASCQRLVPEVAKFLVVIGRRPAFLVQVYAAQVLPQMLLLRHHLLGRTALAIPEFAARTPSKLFAASSIVPTQPRRRPCC